MDVQIETVVSTDALPVGVGNTPVDRACTAELVDFLTSIGQDWLTGPFMANRVLDMETLRTLTTTDLMGMNIPQHPCDFLLQELANRYQARAGARLVSASSSGHAMRCMSCTFRACAFAARRRRRLIGHWH